MEFHRELYAKAGLFIRPQATGSKVDLLKQMAGSIGATPDEIMEALQSLAKPHRVHATPGELEEDKIQALTALFVDKVRNRLNSSPPLKTGDSTG